MVREGRVGGKTNGMTEERQTKEEKEHNDTHTYTRLQTHRMSLSSLCYHYGISQACAKIELIYRCKLENEIYLTKLSN